MVAIVIFNFGTNNPSISIHIFTNAVSMFFGNVLPSRITIPHTIAWIELEIETIPVINFIITGIFASYDQESVAIVGDIRPTIFCGEMVFRKLHPSTIFSALHYHELVIGMFVFLGLRVCHCKRLQEHSNDK